MDSKSQHDNERILQLVGAIVLTCQDTERYLKLTLPFLSSDDDSLGAALRRHEKLKRRTLGELVGNLTDSSSSDSLDFAKYLEQLVNTRNQIVHHFNETYEVRIASGGQKEVIASLESQLTNLRGLRATTEQLALFVLEGLRDVTFHNTPEYEQMAALCATFRQRVAS